MKKIFFVFLFLLLMIQADAGAKFGVTWASFFGSDAQADKAEPKNETKVSAAPVADNLKDLFVELSKRLVPSVVNIYTNQTIKNPWGNGPQSDMYRRFFEQFFGEDSVPNMPQDRRANSLGTGFIIDEKEGLILTNYHVIADADEIKVVLTEQDSEQDGIDAKVVGGDNEADVALIKIKTKRKLVAAPLGDSDQLQVGEWVMAVGNPFGHGHTVTKGIISAKERIIPISQFSNYLQTDTPINPGNSGGPLINTAGQVIGINSAINASAQGIGFAIPINFVKRILPDLRTKGVVTRGFIGVNVTELSPQLAKSLKVKEGEKGVLVSEVLEGEPAHKAGIQAYDLIKEVDGKPVTDGRQLISAISTVAPGSKIKVLVNREGKDKELTVEVGKRPSREAMVGTPRGNGGASTLPSYRFRTSAGLSVVDLDSAYRRELKVPSNVVGVVVSKVVPGSAADEAGLQKGDIIVEVDQKPISSVNAFYQTVREAKVYLLRVRSEDGFAITPLDLSAGPKSKRPSDE